MTTRWREPTGPAEAISKAWLDQRDREALSIVSSLLDEGRHDQLDMALAVLDEEGSPDAMSDLAEAMLVMAEATEEGGLLAFPFEAGRNPSGAALRMSLQPVFSGSLVLHAKPLDPSSLLELPAYTLRAVLSSLMGGKMSPGLVRAHDGNGLGVFVGALKGVLGEAEAPLGEWLRDHGHALGYGLPCSPSGLPHVLDAMEARGRARTEAEAELADFLRVAEEEHGSPVSLRTSVRDGVPWATAVGADGAVVDELAFRDLPLPEAAPPDDDGPPSPGRRPPGRAAGGLRVIRGGRGE